MCLGIPGKVTRWIERAGPFAQAEVEFDGLRRVCHMACVPDVAEGEYVIVHAGIAISRIDAAAAEQVFEALAKLNDDDGWMGASVADGDSPATPAPH